jgi:hypothetical protein
LRNALKDNCLYLFWWSVIRLQQSTASSMNSRVPSWQQAGGGNTNGVRKMVIKPFKTQPKIPENYEQSTWEKLAVAVRAVNSKVAVAISKEELYRVS